MAYIIACPQHVTTVGNRGLVEMKYRHTKNALSRCYCTVVCGHALVGVWMKRMRLHSQSTSSAFSE